MLDSIIHDHKEQFFHRVRRDLYPMESRLLDSIIMRQFWAIIGWLPWQNSGSGSGSPAKMRSGRWSKNQNQNQNQSKHAEGDQGLCHQVHGHNHPHNFRKFDSNALFCAVHPHFPIRLQVDPHLPETPLLTDEYIHWLARVVGLSPDIFHADNLLVIWHAFIIHGYLDQFCISALACTFHRFCCIWSCEQVATMINFGEKYTCI